MTENKQPKKWTATRKGFDDLVEFINSHYSIDSIVSIEDSYEESMSKLITVKNTWFDAIRVRLDNHLVFKKISGKWKFDQMLSNRFLGFAIANERNGEN